MIIFLARLWRLFVGFRHVGSEAWFMDWRGGNENNAPLQSMLPPSGTLVVDITQFASTHEIH